MEHITSLLDANLAKLAKIRAEAMAKKLAAEEEQEEADDMQEATLEVESSIEGSSLADAEESSGDEDASSSNTNDS